MFDRREALKPFVGLCRPMTCRKQVFVKSMQWNFAFTTTHKLTHTTVRIYTRAYRVYEN